MTMMTPDRFIRSVRKTPTILNAILRDVSEEQAHELTDGPGGWSVIEPALIVQLTFSGTRKR